MGNLTSRVRRRDEEAPRNAEAQAQAQRGLYFGPHFVMGGQRFAASGPETFLFGGLTSDLGAISNFGMNRIPHPIPDLQATTTIKSHVNLKKSTLQLVRQPGDEPKYGLQFRFDCDKDCFVSVYFVAKETVENLSSVFVPVHENSSWGPFPFAQGMNQLFTAPDDLFFSPSRYSPEELVSEEEERNLQVFPIVILLEAKHEGEERKQVQSQSTFATLTKNGDGAFDLKILKQKVMVDGISYILQEIFGIEQSPDQPPEGNPDDGLENTRECVVCMADPKDTIALPCRHMCLCSQCAEQLRFQSNKCPICRQPFHSLLQIKIGEVKEGFEPAQRSDAPEVVIHAESPATPETSPLPPPAPAEELSQQPIEVEAQEPDEETDPGQKSSKVTKGKLKENGTEGEKEKEKEKEKAPKKVKSKSKSKSELLSSTDDLHSETSEATVQVVKGSD